MIARLDAGLCRAPVLGVGETGLFVAREEWWLHTVSTPTLTRYAVQPQRGAAAHVALGVLPVFGGTGVHDAYQAFGTARASR